MQLVCEETLTTLVESIGNGQAEKRLRLVARAVDDVLEMEFVNYTNGANLADALSQMADGAGQEKLEQDLSLRLLGGLTTSVEHRQYHDVDILTVRMNIGPTSFRPDG